MQVNLALLLLAASLPLSAQIPTVQILGLRQASHGSVTVEFRTSGPSPNMMRARTSPPGGSCTSGIGGNIEYEDNAGGLNNRKYWPYDDGNTSPIIARALFAGLVPNTTYQLCPEVSADGGNSYSSGVGVTYTTQSLPPVHPAPPIAPAPVNTTYPDTTGYVVVSPTCSTLTDETSNALQRQLGTGTVINVPDCDNAAFQFRYPAADNIRFQSADINLAKNTIGSVAYPGGTCGNGANQVPCLREGMGIRFGNFDAYHNTPPSHLFDVGHATNNLIPYVFYVHFPNPSDTSNFQLFYPQPFSECANCLWRLGSRGSTNPTGLMFVEWPRPASLKYIVFRPPTSESKFAPAGTRITPAWDSKMFHFRNGSFFSGFADDGNQTLQLGNIWVVGWHNSYIPDGEISPKPVTYSAGGGHTKAVLVLQQNDGPIVFDRCWIEGPPFPMRVANPISFDGAGVAFVNGRIDKMYAWHPTSTWEGVVPYPGTGITNTTGTKSFTIGPGEAHGGLFNYKQTGTMHVTLGGVPTNQSGPKRGAIYFDSTGSVKVAVPPGMESTTTTDTGTVVTGADYYNGVNNLNSPVLPQENVGGQNRPAVFPIAFFDVLVDGTLNYLTAAAVQESTCDWNGCEGSDTIIAGRGPGPVKFDNNYFNWNGNFINFDDCLNGPTCQHDVGDYTIRRNYFYHDPNTVRSSPNWNGNLQLHRQGVEWKHGSRDWVIGNIFDGQNGCDNQNPTGTAVLAKTPAGNANDLNIEFNTVMHSCGFSGAGTYFFTNHLLADTMSRVRFANNLIYDSNGWKNSSYYGPATFHGSSGWFFQMNGPVEDLQIVHNTFLDHDGLKPAWIALRETAEGVTIDNNLFFYAQNPGASGGIIFDSAFGDNAGHSSYGSCQSLSDKALLDCIWPGYKFRNNVIIPGNNSSNIWGTSCDNGAGGDGCLHRSQMTASSQMSLSATCTAIGGTLTGSVCSGGLPSTVLPYQSGVSAAVAALNFVNPAKASGANFHLKANSPIISGGQVKATDGNDVGADLDALERAQGKVTLTGVTALGTTSATVTFVAPDSQACPLDYSSSDASLVTTFTRVADPGTNVGTRTVTLSNLTSGTTYRYRVNCAVAQPTGQFRTK